MAYNDPFAFLNPGEVRYLADSDHRRDREIYIDCLALIHDLLTGLGTTPSEPMFDDKEVGRNYRGAVQAFAGQAQDVRFNVEVNFKTGKALHDGATKFHNVPAFVYRTLVDKFIDDLLEQYRVIRQR